MMMHHTHTQGDEQNKKQSKRCHAAHPFQHTTHNTQHNQHWACMVAAHTPLVHTTQHNTGCHCSPCRPPCPANTSTTTTTPPIPHCLAANTPPPPHMARFMLVVAVPQTQQTTWLCAHHPSTPQTIPHSLVLCCVVLHHAIQSIPCLPHTFPSAHPSINKSTSSNNNNNNGV